MEKSASYIGSIWDSLGGMTLAKCNEWCYIDRGKTTVHNRGQGTHMYPIEPNFARSGALVQFIYWCFRQLERIMYIVVVTNPMYTAMDIESQYIFQQLKPRVDELRYRYPRRYAVEESKMNRRYLHLR